MSTSAGCAPRLVATRSRRFGVRGIGLTRPNRRAWPVRGLLWVDIAWAIFAIINLLGMLVFATWETIPFHFIWVSLTLLYGFRVFSRRLTGVILLAVVVSTGIAIGNDARAGTQPWDEIAEVPLMSAMFLAMVWHAHRRQAALRVAKQESEQRAAMLVQQERFLHDASHELRTPVTIARGHLELYRLGLAKTEPELDVALDELQRMERILERLLLLAKADHPGFAATESIDIET